jgi:hypothetical protein
MLDALSVSIAALNAAIKLDVDRTDADRTFFGTERDGLQTCFDAVFAANQALVSHDYLETRGKQACVDIGDAVLDRGVRKGKARMKVELKDSAMPQGADLVFGVDLNELVQAERAEEPKLVLEAVAKFGQVPDFTGKPEMAKDLTTRASRQKDCFADRDTAALARVPLQGAVDKAVGDAATALYRLEKRLSDRFPKQVVYVKAFFLDVAPPRKKKPEGEAPAKASADKPAAEPPAAPPPTAAPPAAAPPAAAPPAGEAPPKK